MKTILCVFSVTAEGEDVLARVSVDGGPSWDIIRPICMSADSHVDEITIVYEVVEDSGNGETQTPTFSDG